MSRLVMMAALVLATIVHGQDLDAGVLETPPAREPPAVAEAAPVVPAPVVPVVVTPSPRPSARERRLGSLGFLGTASVLRSTVSSTQDPLTGRVISVDQRTTVPVLGVRWWTPW